MENVKLPKVPPAYQLVAFESLDSTNEQARRMATEGAPDGTIIWAKAKRRAGGAEDAPGFPSPATFFARLSSVPTHQ